jgi:energy-coupling factor transporter ATP-binding protein EcfA2
MKLILENVRTFSGRHSIRLAPLTIVTGENSSGKTTLLGMLSAVFQLSYPLQPNFNSPPYDLGNFETIATCIGGKKGRARYFGLGYESEPDDSFLGKSPSFPIDPLRKEEAKYVNRKGQVRLSEYTTSGKGFEFSLALDEPTSSSHVVHGRCKIRIDDKSGDVEIEGDYRPTDPFFGAPPLIELLMSQRALAAHAEDKAAVERSRLLVNAVNHLYPRVRPPVSIAPIRTKPERTYSQITETFKPTGDHVPFVLNDILREDSPRRRTLIEALGAFGQDSHLFRKFDVRHLGKKATDPFELMVSVAGRAANLVDVGYGVSQSLPLIVQSALRTPDETLLLQQPEVHLHPRAQAALGSFFARSVASGGGSLVVETHSDYIIDRVRQEVADGKIPPEKVILLYCHRDAGVTLPHELTIDKNGNVVGAPGYYREFFLKEDLRLLGRGE